MTGKLWMPNRIKKISLWMVFAAFLTLALAWAAYPKIYEHFHPPKPSPGIGWDMSRIDNTGPHPAQIAFLVGCLLWGIGFGQLRCARWFWRECSGILFWLFLLLAVCVAIAGWEFSLACRFWTISSSAEFRRAETAVQTAREIWKYSFRGAIVLGLLNIVFARVLGRRVTQ